MAFSYRQIDLDETATLVVGQPTEVTHIAAFNLDSAERWVHLYDAAAAASVTVGTTVPIQSFLIPAGDGTNRGAWSQTFSSGILCTAGLVVASTTTVDGSTAPTNDLILNLGYK